MERVLQCYIVYKNVDRPRGGLGYYTVLAELYRSFPYGDNQCLDIVEGGDDIYRFIPGNIVSINHDGVGDDKPRH